MNRLVPLIVRIGAGGIAVAVVVGVAPIATSAAPVPSTGTRTEPAPRITVQVHGPGVISARGAAVRIPLLVTCAKGYRANVSVQVVEALGDRFASGGDGGRGFACAGGKQTVSVDVQASPTTGASPFKPGPASLVATVYAEYPSQCGVDAPCPEAQAPSTSREGDNPSDDFRGTVRLVSSRS